MTVFESAYKRLLTKCLTESELRSVAAGQSVPNDYCDANMLLLDAWRDVYGECAFGADGRLSEETLNEMNRAMCAVHPLCAS